MKLLLQKRETTAILVNVISIKMLLTFPRTLVLNAGNAAWMQVLYSTVIAFLIYFLTVKIYERADKRDVLDLSAILGGKAFKILIGLVMTAILILNMAITIRAFPESVKTVLLTETNMGFIMIMLGIAVGLGAYLGIEALGRIHTLFLPVSGIVLIGFFLLAIPYWKTNNIFPIFGLGPYHIFVKGFHSISIFADIILLNILLPYCKNYNEAKRSGYYAILIGGAVSFIIVITYNLIYPYPASTEFIMPAYQISRIVRMGSFFQRWEAFFEFVWSISLYMYSAVYIVIISFILKKTFDLKYHKPLIFPIVAFSCAIAFLPASVLDMMKSLTKVSYIMYPIAFSLPIVLGMLYRIKAKRGELHEKKS